MSSRPGRLFDLRSGEFGLVLTLGLTLMGNALALQVSGIVAISGFLTAGDANHMPIIWLVDYSLILLFSGLQTLIVDKFDRVRLMGGLNLAFALAFVVLRLMFAFGAADGLNYALMYLLAEQQFLFFPLIFWVLANDMLSMAQAKRLFPLIASWSFLGKLLGIGVVALSPGLFDRLGVRYEQILLLNVLIYLLLYLLVRLKLRRATLRKTTHKRETVRETLSEGWNFVRQVPSFRYLTLALLALAVCVTIIEFRFLVVSEDAFGDQASYQRFYSLYRLIATVTSFAVQIFLTGWMIKRLKLKNVFFIFPALALASALGMMVLPGISMAVTAMLMSKLPRGTVHESAIKSFQALVPEERRGRVSTFMDSYLFAFGIILACPIIGAIVLVGLWQGQDLRLAYLAVGASAALFALWATLRMRAVYESSLLNWRLKRRRRGTSLLDKLEF